VVGGWVGWVVWVEWVVRAGVVARTPLADSKQGETHTQTQTLHKCC